MLFGFAVCAALLAYAVFAQYGAALRTCPLCIFQRVAMAAVGASACSRRCTSRRARPDAAWGLLAFLAAAVGAGIAARHVWLQHLPPDQVPACGPGPRLHARVHAQLAAW